MKKSFTSITLADLDNVAKEIHNIIESFGGEDGGNSYVIHLKGEMGAGKTTFTKSLAKSFNIKDDIQSPTFTIMREYNILNNKRQKLLHIDAYRFENKEEGKILGLHKKTENNNLVIIEWPENTVSPEPNMIINIEKLQEENLRNIYVETK
ncbi:MAG: tRNA threonylcarbamoyladenosine biosynthesis protein TsaE [Patescibacteria group bacterium]|nr:tRNA threonylcarbamoyladenosine biosynthesis protein TsaE [Patescibacteria group bacterium]